MIHKKIYRFLFRELEVGSFYGIPVLAAFLIEGAVNTRLLFFAPFYITFATFFLSVHFLAYMFREIEKGDFSSMSEFFGRMITFIFAIMIIFGMTYTAFSNETSYLVESGKRVTSLDEAIYFSGITLITIGYGDIVPVGGFRNVALFEGMLGIVIIFTFIALGASLTYQATKEKAKDKRMQRTILAE